MLSRLIVWLRAMFQRRQFEQDLELEIAFHLEQRAAQLMQQGMDPAQAERQARLDFGMTETHRDAVRQARGLAAWDSASQSVRLAWRSLMRAPGFTATAVVVLGLPMAAMVMLYAVFASYAFNMPPISHPERWLYLEGAHADSSIDASFTDNVARALMATPPSQAEGLFTHLPVFELVTTEQENRGLGAAVSDNFFELMGVPPIRGRLWFGRDDSRDNHSLILSELGWRKLFENADDVVGRQVAIADRSYTVIGVVGNQFAGIMEVGTLYFVRDQERPRAMAAGHNARVEVGGFLREGASVASLTAALSARARELTHAADEDQQLTAINAVIRYGILREKDRTEAMLAGAPIALVVVLILLVAAANLANLVLARFLSRRQELATRAALGAGQLRIFSQLLLECLLLGLLSGALAMLLVVTLVQPIYAAIFGLLSEMGLDMLPLTVGFNVALMAALLAIISALGFGVLPAWWMASRGVMSSSTHSHGTSETIAFKQSEPRAMRGALLALQLAVSVFLVVIAGLVATNADMSQRATLGFDPTPLVAIRGQADGGKLAEALRRLPAVSEVSATSTIPFVNPMIPMDATHEGQTDRVRVRYIDHQWWSLMGRSPRVGRSFYAGEDGRSNVALASRRAAELLWPGQQVLGRNLRLRSTEDDKRAIDQRVEVVGLADDYATGWLVGDAAGAVLYLPALTGSAEASVLLMRMREASPAQLVSLLRECRRVDPLASCQPLRLSDALNIQRVPLMVGAVLSTSLAWLALAISCVGLYGLVSFAVVQQRRALGVRLALGASASDVIAQVMRGAVRPLLWGLSLGLLLAAAASRLLAHLSEFLSAFSLEAFLYYPMVLVVMAMLASWLPARRSARIPLSDCLKGN